MLHFNPKSIVFDFDLTLADSTHAVTECINLALRDMGHESANEEAARKTIGHTLQDAYRMLTKCEEIARGDLFHETFVGHADRIMVQMIDWLPGIPEMLQQLHDKGIPMAIVSTKFRYRILDILAHLEAGDWFDLIVGGEDVEKMKPDPTGLIHAFDQLNTPVEKGLYVGDTLIDWQTAQNAGCHFLAVLTGPTRREEFEKAGAHTILGSAIEIPEFLGIKA